MQKSLRQRRRDFFSLILLESDFTVMGQQGNGGYTGDVLHIPHQGAAFTGTQFDDQIQGNIGHIPGLDGHVLDVFLHSCRNGIFGIQIACQMTFVAIGNAKASIIVAVVRKFVLLLPLIYIMPALMEDKTLAVYTAEPVADVIAVTFTAILFFFQFRKALRSMDKPAEKTA